MATLPIPGLLTEFVVLGLQAVWTRTRNSATSGLKFSIGEANPGRSSAYSCCVKLRLFRCSGRLVLGGSP